MTEQNTVPVSNEAEQRHIERAKNDSFADGGIVRYYEQALALGAGEAVLEAIEVRMRTDFPAAARKLFGAKGEQAEDLLERAQQAVRARFDLSDNGRGNHVMVGGDERRTGEAYLSRYIAYRGKGKKEGAMLGLIQESAGAELRARVRSDSVRSPGAQPVDRWFSAADFPLAQEAYIELLGQLDVPLAKAEIAD
jgi:hypothetical protein